jgi:phage gpG-like protein
MSLRIILDLRGLVAAEAALDRLSPLDEAKLLDGLARTIQMQTRRRIEEDKKAPDGTPWQPNMRGGSVLYLTGALARSIDYVVTGMRAIVGSGLIYSRIQQEGGTIVPKDKKALAFQMGNGMAFAQSVTLPPRPYIGVSQDNREELIDIAVAFIRRRIGV